MGIPIGRLLRAARAAPEQGLERIPIAGRDQVARVLEPGEIRVERVEHRVAVRREDVEPDRGMTRSDTGHVPEPARRESQQRAVLRLVRRRDVHERRRRELRDVADERDEYVVVVRRHRHDLGLHAAQQRAQGGVRLFDGRGRRREYPGRADEHVGAGAVDALLLGTRHRMTADEPGGAVGTPDRHRVDDRALHRADVGDERDARLQELHDRVGNRADRQRDERDVDAGRGRREIGGRRSDRTELDRALEPVGVAVEAHHLVAQGRERETDRAAHEARADHCDAHGYSGRSSRSDRAPSRYTWWSSPRVCSP